MSRRLKITALTVVAVITMVVTTQGQITVPRKLSSTIDRTATLQEQLTNRLKAITTDQKAYIRRLVKLVEQGKLETRLVIGLERHAIRRRAAFPFPLFERAIKVEAAKRGVYVPTVKEYLAANTKVTR